MLKIFLTALIVLIAAEAQAACVPTADGKQDCSYPLHWDWEKGDGGDALGFVMQQQVDSGVWHDILDPIPITERSILDVIKGDVGGRPIDYRIVSYNETERSDPSNTASVVTPAIAAGGGVSITTKKTVPPPSRRGGSGSSIVAALLNANDNETVIQTDKQLAVSRRAHDGSSIVPILVNADEIVTVNGVVQ